MCEWPQRYFPYSVCEQSCFTLSTGIDKCLKHQGVEGCICPKGTFRDGMMMMIIIILILILLIMIMKLEMAIIIIIAKNCCHKLHQASKFIYQGPFGPFVQN